MNVRTLIKRKGLENPETTSIIFDGEEFSRKWHCSTANQTSHLARELGLAEEDKIAYISYNSPDFLATIQVGKSGSFEF